MPDKPIIDWSVRQERDDLVSVLVADAIALLYAGGGEGLSSAPTKTPGS